MSENLSSGATEALPEVPTTVPTAEQIQELVTWYQTYFTQISDCCTSKGLPKPPRW